jgi:DNA-binding NarL/FixJ family response regulator
MTRRRSSPSSAAPTAQEIAVLRSCLVHGSVKVAAARLRPAITESTAKSYLRNLYRRLGVADRSQAVAALDVLIPGWRD